MIRFTARSKGQEIDVSMADQPGNPDPHAELPKPPIGSPPSPKEPSGPAAQADKKETDAPDKHVGFLLAGLTSVIALLTTLGAVSGGLERMFRNKRFWAGASLLLVLLGTAGIVLAFGLKWDKPAKGGPWRIWESRTRLVVASTLVFVIGVGLGVWLAVQVPSMREKPRIQATLSTDPELKLDATVDAAGVGASTSVQVLVDGWVGADTRQRLMSETVGPSTSGEIHVPVTIVIPPGRYDFVTLGAGDLTAVSDTECTPTHVEGGCVVITLPSNPTRPLLSAQLVDANGTLVVRASSSGGANDSVVLLQVTGSTKTRRASPLFRGFFPADKQGMVDQEVMIPLTPLVRTVCVVAETDPTPGARAHCARSQDTTRSYLTLSIPSGGKA